ncbi:MAG: pyridoxal phosphate-dependent aminotransferase, partial [Candidatus Cloacimonadota bacterium]|nr:pyridoxal phosphate-dependent aminotransferase [Candidatus Cloacimonadota bacterium]
MKLSKRTEYLQASPLRKLMPYANSAKEKGIKIYHLNIGQPDIETPKVILDAYHNFDKKVVAYGPSQGLLEYRKKLAKYYVSNNINVDEDDIIVTTAGSEALIFALLATCDAGDEVIIPEPFYTNYNGFAGIAGVNISAVTTYAKDGFALPNRELFEEKITSKTKAIMLCNPGNPTGVVYTKDEVQMVVDIAKKHNLFVISDEVYREFVYDGNKHTSILHYDEIYDRAILVDSVSKRYSACGSRIGCIISKNKEVMAGVLKYAMARLCPPTIDQIAASAATSLGNDYFSEVISEYEGRRNIVFDALSKIDGIVCKKPQGAFYVVASLPIDDAEDFVKW